MDPRPPSMAPPEGIHALKSKAALRSKAASAASAKSLASPLPLPWRGWRQLPLPPAKKPRLGTQDAGTDGGTDGGTSRGTGTSSTDGGTSTGTDGGTSAGTGTDAGTSTDTGTSTGTYPGTYAAATWTHPEMPMIPGPGPLAPPIPLKNGPLR